jgi:DNA-directed RNA polymerase specialized sigma24 family protein
MVGSNEMTWRQAFRDADEFLGRWRDTFTRNARADIAQEAAFATWLTAPTVRDPHCLPALARTISRRLRGRALKRHRGLGEACLGRGGKLLDQRDLEDGADCLLVLGVPIARPWLLARLERRLMRLSDLNRALLLGFYEGFCCAELAVRFHLSEDAVKVRLFRYRRRIQRELEAEVRAAGHLDP